MFTDPVSFNGGTRFEVIAVLANCGRDTDKAKRALVRWIRHKQEKGRSTQHILSKLQDIESKFIKDISLHNAFRDARAETFLPRAADNLLPSPISRRSGMQVHTLESPSKSPNARRNVTASGLFEVPVNSSTQISPAISSLRLSRDSSSQMSESSGKSHTSRRSFPPDVPPLLSTSSPRIQIPGEQTLKPGPSSPIASAEDSGIHHRYRLRSNSEARAYRSQGLPTPPPTSPPEFSLSPSSFRQRNTDTGNSHVAHGLISPLPSPQIHIPENRPRRGSGGTTTTSPPYSSSEESDFRPKYRPLSQPTGAMSPGGLRRVTPPMTSPPRVPLPPLPIGIQGVHWEDGGASRTSIPIENLHLHYPTPVRSPAPQPSSSSSAVRPLPIQPIPSPVPGSDESVTATDIIGESAWQRRWKGSDSQLSISNDIVRGDSPLYMPHDDAGDHDDDGRHTAISPSSTGTGIGPPPSYADYLDTYFPPEMPTVPTIKDALDRAVKVCGDSPEVRLEVSRCIEFQRGYEPPYWQTRLQACGLNAEAARYLVDEMCGQVDWSASKLASGLGPTSKTTR